MTHQSSPEQEHKRQIAYVKEEIAWVLNELSVERYCDLAVLQRLLAYPQAHLKELTRPQRGKRKPKARC